MRERALHHVMSATVMTMAQLIAIKAVKRNMQAQGLKLAHVERLIIISAAAKYLRDEHPALLDRAAETVQSHPKLRTLAEREARRRKGNHNE